MYIYKCINVDSTLKYSYYRDGKTQWDICGTVDPNQDFNPNEIKKEIEWKARGEV